MAFEIGPEALTELVTSPLPRPAAAGHPMMDGWAGGTAPDDSHVGIVAPGPGVALDPEAVGPIPDTPDARLARELAAAPGFWGAMAIVHRHCRPLAGRLCGALPCPAGGLAGCTAAGPVAQRDKGEAGPPQACGCQALPRPTDADRLFDHARHANRIAMGLRCVAAEFGEGAWLRALVTVLDVVGLWEVAAAVEIGDYSILVDGCGDAGTGCGMNSEGTNGERAGGAFPLGGRDGGRAVCEVIP
jgi:hypothetical protein